jgi:Tol biopolymer transport system component
MISLACTLSSRPTVDVRFDAPTFIVKSAEPPALDEDTGVRGELAETQSREGLTIADYGSHGLRIVDFYKRKVFRGVPLPDSRAAEGTVSQDGTMVAFALLRPTQVPSIALGIMKADNSDLRELLNIAHPGQMCWSYDMIHLAMGTVDPTTATFRLTVLDTATNFVKDLAPHVDRVSSQCWSPSGKEIVFESDGNVIIDDIEEGNPRTLVVGKVPTWSPDGNWIAYLDEREHNFYAIHPSGEGKKRLFHSRDGMAGLYWSPDARIVAYVVEKGGLSHLDAEAYTLIVRRLQDGSEDWINNQNVGCCESIQWVRNKALIARIESESQ